MKLRTVIVCVTAACLHGSAVQAQEPDGVSDQLLERILQDFEAIRAGATREELEENFRLDGGLQSPERMFFVHPLCAYCKVSVDFSVQRDPQDLNRAVSSVNDPAIGVSRPYLERPHID